MKKLIIALSMVACFMAAYAIGGYLRSFPLSPRAAFFAEPARNVTRDAKAIQAVPRAAGGPAPAPAEPQKDPVEAIQKAKGPELMQAMRAVPHVPFQRVQEALRRRFSENYPKHEQEQIKEAANRIGVISAVGSYRERMLSRSEQQQLMTFLEEVASNANENPAVRETATRAQLPFLGRMEEDERNDILARTPASQIDRASRPVGEIVEELFREIK